MDIYSPSLHKAENFRKNTTRNSNISEKIQANAQRPVQKNNQMPANPNKKNEINRNSKFVLTGKNIELEMDNSKRITKQDHSKRNSLGTLIGFLKIKFIERMKYFFDFEDSYDENVSKKTWIE